MQYFPPPPVPAIFYSHSGQKQSIAVTEGAAIGTATMLPDGTIVMDLRATGQGIVGHGRLTYAPGTAHYQEMLQHLGGLRPGETKLVAPFPD